MSIRQFSLTIAAATIQNLRTTSVTQTTIALAWDAYPGATAYQVYRSTTQGSLGTLVLTPTATTYSNSGHTAGTSYTYAVRPVVGGSGVASAQASIVVTTAQTSSYTPFIAWAFQEGTVGQELIGFDQSSWAGSQATTYSSDLTGPFGESKVLKVTTEAGRAGYGGTWTLAQPIPVASLAADGDMWIRLYHYFPTEFCAGYGSSGDGYGATKWLRLQFSTSETTRITLELGNFSGGACATASASPTFNYVAMEGAVGGNFYYFGTPGVHSGTGSGPVIPRNTWAAIQLQVHWSTVAANSFMRGWINDTYCGERYGAATLPSSGSLSQIYLGDYWNGTSLSTTQWYIANMIATRQRPNTLDSGGRPYISPTTRAQDF